MSKVKHTTLAVTSATLASELQASVATATTTSSANCTKSGLRYVSQVDPRTTTTTATPITTGGSGTITEVVVNDSETTVS